MDRIDIPAMKAAARARLAQARRELDASQRAELSAQVRQRLAVLPELATAQRVLGYCATQDEVDVAGLLDALLARGVEVALPWVVPDAPGRSGRLGVSVVTDIATQTGPGWRGVREPLPAARRPVRPDALDAVLAPGVGFDVDGNRVGHGGGHFDRLLARLRRGAVVIGVAFDEQLTDRLPVEPHDRPMDVVVTPTRTLRR